MFDFDALNPAFQDAEADLPDIYDEDGEYDEEYDEELMGDMYEGYDGRYYESWDFDG